MRRIQPEITEDVACRVADGRLSTEHPATGFGTRYVYELALDDGRLRGWMRVDAAGRTFFSATLDLGR